MSLLKKQQHIIDRQATELTTLKHRLQQITSDIHYQLTQTSRYERRPVQMAITEITKVEQFMNKAIELIPRGSQSNRWLNHLQLEMNSDQDCRFWTGQSLSSLLFQSKLCKVNPFWIFQCRVRMYKYLTYKLQALIYGLSETQLTAKIKQTFPLMARLYARLVLLNGEPLAHQKWTRERVAENTPDFVYMLYDTTRADADFVVLNQDSTYQFIQTCQSSHNIRKQTLNMHKNKRHLLKVHIIACANGQPVFALVTFGDGHHSDGYIWRGMMDSVYVDKCLQHLIQHGEGPNVGRRSPSHPSNVDGSDEKTAQQTPLTHPSNPDGSVRVSRRESKKYTRKYGAGNIAQSQEGIQDSIQFDPENFSFRTIELCRTLQNLHQLIDIEHGDKAVMDNGYQIAHPCAQATKDAPKPLQAHLMTAEAIYQRLLVFIRQTQERVNQWCKRNEMLRSTIVVEDVPLMQSIWNIALADMVHENVILMKDDTNSHTFARRLLDYRYVDVNPCDFWEPARGEFANKKISKGKAADKEEAVSDASMSTESDNMSDDEERPFTQQELAMQQATKKDYQVVAVGWDNIRQWLASQEWLRFLFEDIQEFDVNQQIGKRYQNNVTNSYLRRMHLYTANLTLRQHKENVYCLMLDNIKSRYKSSQRYYNVLNLAECYYYKRSLQKLTDPTVELPQDEQHWYLWLRCKSESRKVSEFLHEKHRERVRTLRARMRVLRRKRRLYVWNGINFQKFCKALLRHWYREEGINEPIIGKEPTQKQLRDHLLQALRNKYNEPDCLMYRHENWGYLTKEDIIYRYQVEGIELPGDPDTTTRAFLRDHLLTILKRQPVDSLCKPKIKPLPPPPTATEEAASEAKVLAYFEEHELWTMMHQPRLNKCTVKVLKAYIAKAKISSTLQRKYLPTPTKVRKRHLMALVVAHHHRKRTQKELETADTRGVVTNYERGVMTRRKLQAKKLETVKNQQAATGLLVLDEDGEYDRFWEDRLEFIDDVGNKPPREAIPQPLQYMHDYPEPKLWWDLDFTIVNSKLARLQSKCRCYAGQPVPGCCAHTGSWLRLLFFSVKQSDEVAKFLTESKRDKFILDTVADMKPYKEYLDLNEEYIWKAKGCFCQTPKDEPTFLCNGCDVYYHPSCLGTTADEIRDNTWLDRAFFCHHCHLNKIWMVKHQL